MTKRILFLMTFLAIVYGSAQELTPTLYQEEFNAAYVAYPNIPKGILEGVAYAQTRIRHISGNNESCTGIPQVRGVMGLTENGQGYFNNNLEYVARVSGYSVHEIKTNPATNIMAYAHAYSDLVSRKAVGLSDFSGHDQILKTLSEIPWNKNAGSDFALSCFTYEVFQFMNNPTFQTAFELPARSVNLAAIYGASNLEVLSSKKIAISEEAVLNERMHKFESFDRTAEYGPALWNGTPACNYSSRAGVAVSAVTVHTIQGSYAGAISWALNCASNVSYHYVVRSSDGQITQMLLEADKGWHVGSENPYTIGIEHEGYVDDPVWYTEAMYVASADLVRDITESGYGISPLRTYQGVATAGTLTLGGCTKIKGHQHFPGASHTDPGINWNWEHYYQLINNSPDVTTYTAEDGTLFDSGGAAGDYEDDERFLYLISPAGATSITLNVVHFNIESGWDYMHIYDGDDLDAALIGTFTGTTIPDIIYSSGGSILLEFRSDCGITTSGWEIGWTSVIGDGVGDELAPHTEVILDAAWYTEDFSAVFTDADDFGGSGIHHQFYQVIDFNGTEWRANANHGFFSDNFDDEIHADWTTHTGSWGISVETLQQSDEELTNTNIYAAVNQNDFDKYLYHWSGKISGVGTNKRAGLHIMCDDPTLTNRGNSYFVWFREDDNQAQIFKVTDDVFSLEESVDFPFSPDIWYDFKTVFDRTTGEITLWINNARVVTWIDPAPWTTGTAVSFRSGNAVYNVNNFKVYHNRAEDTWVEIGPDGDARYQNPDPYTPAAKVKSIVVDSAKNISVIGSQLVDIDWTPPLALTFLNDGVGADIATTTSNTELAANWSETTDMHSGIARYWYAIGTSPGETDIVDWTDNWYADSVVHTGLSLTLGETYYFAVVAENGAGLISDTIYSNGQTLIEPTEPPVALFGADHTNLCGADSVLLENGSTDALSYEWFIPEGSPSYSTEINPYVSFEISGIYVVTLVATGPGGVDTLIQSVSVEVDAQPLAAFTPSALIVSIDEPLVTFENASENADGYFWNFGDGNFSTDDSPWHNYSDLGTFEVALIAINGDCPNDTATTSILVTDTYGIAEEGMRLKVYPVPAKSVLNLAGLPYEGMEFNYRIYDSAGKLVQETSTVYSNNMGIEVGHLAAGTYQLELAFDQGLIQQKIILE